MVHIWVLVITNRFWIELFLILNAPKWEKYPNCRQRWENNL